MIYIVLALIFLAAVVRWDTPATAIVSRSGRTTDDHPRRHQPAHGARHHSCALAANAIAFVGLLIIPAYTGRARTPRTAVPCDHRVVTPPAICLLRQPAP